MSDGEEIDPAVLVQQVEELRAQLTEAQNLMAELRGARPIEQNEQNNQAQPPAAPPATDSTENVRIDNYRVPKLAPFNRKNPQMWFARAEATFRTARMTNQNSKADTIIAMLDDDTSELIADLILHPVPDHYDAIKSKLISLYSESDETKLRRLIRGQLPLEGKPSHICARMKALAGENNFSETTLMSLFMEHMPDNLKPILTAAQKTTVSALAEFADLIYDSSNANNVSAVQQPANISAVRKTNELEEISKKIDKLAESIAKLAENRSRSTSRHGKYPNQNRARSRSRDSSGLCRLHKKYGDKANYCLKPCNFKPSANSTN